MPFIYRVRLYVPLLNSKIMEKNISDLQVKDLVKQNSSIVIVAILSITLIGAIALIRNTDTEIGIQFGEEKSVNIKGKRPSSLSEKTNDCLPGGESSHRLNCDNH